MAGAISEVFRSLSDTPLGQGDGEQQLHRPYNALPATVLVYVRNWSGIKRRKTIKEPISWLRGGTLSVTKNPAHKGAGISVQALREEARLGKDPSWYEYKVEEIKYAKLTWDSREFLIPSRDQAGTLAPEIMIPDGVMDLYCGNWSRMHGDDVRERNVEIEKLAMRGKSQFICTGPDEDGTWPDDEYADPFPFGYIEFIRREIAPSAVVDNKERIYAHDVGEV